MANWRIDINVSFEINSDDIEAWSSFRQNRRGSIRDLLVERAFLELTGSDRMDGALQWNLLQRPSGINSEWTLDGATVKSGTDGVLTLPNVFTSLSTTFVARDVGRVIHVPSPASPALAEGRYLITGITTPNIVTVDGVVPTAATGLTFDVNEPAEFLVTLLSVP